MASQNRYDRYDSDEAVRRRDLIAGMDKGIEALAEALLSSSATAQRTFDYFLKGYTRHEAYAIEDAK